MVKKGCFANDDVEYLKGVVVIVLIIMGVEYKVRGGLGGGC
jgi:hypothetical protein